MDKQRRKEAWVKMGNPYPFIEATNGAPPHFPVDNRLFPKRHDGLHGWVTHTRIDGNPAIRGHGLCCDKTCQGNRLAICAMAGCGKTVRIMTRP